MKTLEINGITFELQKYKGDLVDAYHKYLDMYLKDTRRLYDCYDNPSTRKQNIYDWWLNYFRDCKQKGIIESYHNCGVRSYNCMMFTLHGVFEMDGNCFIYDITPSHNYLIPCTPNHYF